MEKVRDYVKTRLTYGFNLPGSFSDKLIDLNIEKALDFFKSNSKHAGFYENISLKNNFELLTQQAHLDIDVLAVLEVNIRNENDNTKKFFYNTTNKILTILGHIRHDEMNAMVIRYVGDDNIMSTQLFKDYCVILCKKNLICLLETYTSELPEGVSINIKSVKKDLKISEVSFWKQFS